MSAERVNHVNIGLMVLACAAAIVAPFHLFLFAYAVLGPLHYLTEVSWLHDRKFFASSHRRPWLLLVLATTAVMAAGYVSSDLLHRPMSPMVEIGMFLLVFVAASVASFVRHPVNAIALVRGPRRRAARLCARSSVVGRRHGVARASARGQSARR